MERHPKPVPMTPRIHLFPYRTQKLSLVVPKILGWRRPGKIGRCRLFSLITARWSSGQDGGLSRRKREFDSPTGHQKKGRKNRGPYAPLAQLVEQLTLNQRAQGSSPWRCTKQKPACLGWLFCLVHAPAPVGAAVPGGERRLRRMQRAGAGWAAAQSDASACLREAARHAATGLHRSHPAGAPIHLAGTLGLKNLPQAGFSRTASTGGALSRKPALLDWLFCVVYAPAPVGAAVLFNNESVIFSSNDVRCSPH